MDRRRFTGVLLGGAAALASSRLRAQLRTPAAETFGIVPFIGVAERAVRDVDAALRAGLGVETRTLPEAVLFSATWNIPHDRWDVGQVIATARGLMQPPLTRVVGVVATDISPTFPSVCDWRLGDYDRTGLAVSVFRCERNARDETQVRFRLASAALHLAAHSLGMLHCPDTACVMVRARGDLRVIDRTSGRLCMNCHTRLGILAARAGAA